MRVKDNPFPSERILRVRYLFHPGLVQISNWQQRNRYSLYNLVKKKYSRAALPSLFAREKGGHTEVYIPSAELGITVP